MATIAAWLRQMEQELLDLRPLEVIIPREFPGLAEVLEMDPQVFEYASPEDLKRWMYLLSQYLLYVQYQADAIAYAAQQAKTAYEQCLNDTASTMSGRTLKERQAAARDTEPVRAAWEEWRLLQQWAARLQHVPDGVREMLYTVRAAYHRTTGGG